MFHYKAHGLGIASELFFPELIKKKSNIDIIIKFGTIHSESQKYKEFYLRKNMRVRILPNKTYLLWNDIDICSINNGKEIIINHFAACEEKLIRLIVLNVGMAILLHQRGRLVLHANAINVNGLAVVLLGHGGIGKSTTSLYFNKRGHKILSDDVSSIKINGNGPPIIFPSFPRIKLWPDVLNSFLKVHKHVPTTHSNTDKRSYSVSENFLDTPIYLRSIYLIEESNEIAIKEISQQRSIIELVKSSYCFPMFNKAEIYHNLKMCSKILNKVPLKILNVQRSFENLDKVIEIIERDKIDLHLKK